MLMNIKMPTIVGILTLYEHDKFHALLSWAWKKIYDLEARPLDKSSMRCFLSIQNMLKLMGKK